MEIWYLITLIGTPEFWLAFTGVLVLAYLFIRRRIPQETRRFVRHGILIFIISLWVTAGIAFSLKYSIPIERPCVPCAEGITECNPYCMEDNSFPSGHTAVIFCVVTSVLLVFRKKKLIVLFAVSFLVALSRYFLRVHYPVDILTGAVIGTFVPIIVYEIYRKRSGFVS
ncbi:MAG: phosphatase PAP2 family protein [Candidatus Aenigmarchaeota archaeon]|nr:phosphatase PAP2 family protein [Candidatus Aenigmarchaeota archaeon]NIP40334.1 phosphatase PAP2 family protein [Candidatus Aenigmarchaeota archaeon]NIQ17828.1 phosphatase PAP2 family protein [Candidatus Aenigmarchaeota archaeon]NIS73209.1 phosphatase PAP2 family protein [Candidatus Aenigmarchaeota archaeon]